MIVYMYALLNKADQFPEINIYAEAHSRIKTTGVDEEKANCDTVTTTKGSRQSIFIKKPKYFFIITANLFYYTFHKNIAVYSYC